jgi:hypothetical protein
MRPSLYESSFVVGDNTNKGINVNEVAFEWLQIADEEGWPIPEPKGRLVFA